MLVFRYWHLLKYQPSRLGQIIGLLETYRNCNQLPNDLGIDVASRAYAEARFNSLSPHSELNLNILETKLPKESCQYQYTDFRFAIQ